MEPGNESDETFEAAFFRAHPRTKASIQNDESFHRWRGSLAGPIPGYPVTAYVLDGDTILDEDQLMFHWGYIIGIIPEELKSTQND